MKKDAIEAKATLEKIRFLSDCCKDKKLYKNMAFYSLTYEQDIPKLEEVVGTGLVADGILQAFVGDDQETVGSLISDEAQVAYIGLGFCVWLSHPAKDVALYLFYKVTETHYDSAIKECIKWARRYKKLFDMLPDSIKKEECCWI